MIGLILYYVIIGLIVGGLGRLIVPGRNPIGLLMTIVLGIVGALAGGMISYALGLHGLLSLLVSVLVAAGLVYLISGSRTRPPVWRRRRRAYW